MQIVEDVAEAVVLQAARVSNFIINVVVEGRFARLNADFAFKVDLTDGQHGRGVVASAHRHVVQLDLVVHDVPPERVGPGGKGQFKPLRSVPKGLSAAGVERDALVDVEVFNFVPAHWDVVTCSEIEVEVKLLHSSFVFVVKIVVIVPLLVNTGQTGHK
jgi:hypothetical protein